MALVLTLTAVQHGMGQLLLGLRQRTCADLIEAVLGGNYEKRLRQRMTSAVNTDAANRHRLQQCALSAGAGAVDLISQQNLTEQWPRLETEFRRARIKDIDAGEVGRQKITGEADALEIEGRSSCEGFGQGRFTHPRPILNQQMAPGQEAAQGQPHLILLAQQHLSDGLHQLLKGNLGQRIQFLALPIV